MLSLHSVISSVTFLLVNIALSNNNFNNNSKQKFWSGGSLWPAFLHIVCLLLICLLSLHSAVWQSVEETLGCRCTRLYLDSDDADDSFIVFFFLSFFPTRSGIWCAEAIHSEIPKFHLTPSFLFAVLDSWSYYLLKDNLGRLQFYLLLNQSMVDGGPSYQSATAVT